MTTMNVISGGLLVNVIKIRNICTLTAKEVAIYVSLMQFIVQREFIVFSHNYYINT
jgi:hypothetical protein